VTGSERKGDETALDIYLIAIGGTGMAPIACLLKEAGHQIRGADGPLYPPMSTLLEAAGIEPLIGYDPGHLTPKPDLVIVGNAVPRTNPEAREVEVLGLERISMPQAVARFFLRGRRPLVIAGTHGKTTTTSIASWVYSQAGLDPGYLIGGVPLDLGRSFARGSGERFIIEGDEYNAAYFDRGPKFLHYRPEALILTSVEYDHADLYPDPESLLDAYRGLVRLVPQDGLLVACGDSEAVREIAREASCRIVFYGLAEHNDLAPVGAVELDGSGTRLTIHDSESGAVDLDLRLAGEHNASNALAVWAVARADGLPAEAVAGALAEFNGVRRRMDELGTRGGITVVDDFAHHPTAVASTIAALRGRYPGRRLVLLFEPRSLTAGRSFLYNAYRRALIGADLCLFAPIFHHDRLEPDERLDLERLTEDLGTRGVAAEAYPDLDRLFGATLDALHEGDVVVTMSSGDFGGMPHRILASLADRN
jgi:UDP-N-acetylmuramate: L-alanyl-gamma-D-glutamyl-meso-diaminopimelate ligase